MLGMPNELRPASPEESVGDFKSLLRCYGALSMNRQRAGFPLNRTAYSRVHTPVEEPFKNTHGRSHRRLFEGGNRHNGE
jgi:hypothetical protein